VCGVFKFDAFNIAKRFGLLSVLTTIVVVLNPFHKFVYKRFNAFAVVFCFNSCAGPIGMRFELLFAKLLDNLFISPIRIHSFVAFVLFDAVNITKRFETIAVLTMLKFVYLFHCIVKTPNMVFACHGDKQASQDCAEGSK
jgi:hypothetical protein